MFRRILQLMMVLAPLAALLLLVNLPISAESTAANWAYTSPRSDAKLVSAFNNVAIRHGALLKASSLSGKFTVIGSVSGPLNGSIKLSVDETTAIFTPGQPFTPGESVTVTVASGIQTQADVALDGLGFTFQVSPKPLDSYPSAVATSGAGAQASAMQGPDFATIPASFPAITVTVAANGASDGYLFLANFRWLDFNNSEPYLMILDNEGEPVYIQKQPTGAISLDFKRQPSGILTYFDSADDAFYGLDNSYSKVATYRAGNGYVIDRHELLIRDNGNVILMAYDDQPVDMSQIVAGGHPSATVTGLVLQEIDSADNVVFQWRSWDHFAITDATISLTTTLVDYVHGNSIDVDADGNWIFSSRSMDEVTKIDRNTGAIVWRLGGLNNQFALSGDTQYFARQHDARRIANGHLTVFDNGAISGNSASRVVEYELDETAKTAKLVWQYENVDEESPFSRAMGNGQRLDNGNTVIGWGSSYPTLTEVRADGSKAFELRFAEPHVSYRAFRFPWQGFPAAPPQLFARPEDGNIVLTYRWNGATEVKEYQIFAGDAPQPVGLLTTEGRRGFETTTILSNTMGATTFFRIMPIDKNDQPTVYSNDAMITNIYLPLVINE